MACNLQVINGRNTYLSAVLFADRIFITVSQFSTFGTLLTGSLTSHPDGEDSITVRTVLGAPADEAEADAVELIARRVTQSAYKRYRRPLFLGCGLRGCDMESARVAVGAVESLLDKLEAAVVHAATGGT